MNHIPDFDHEAYAEWATGQRANQLANFRKRRPVRLRHTGELDPRIAAWGKDLLAGTAGNLVIVGGIGVGKTWSAWEVLDRAVEAGYRGRIVFATAAEWMDATTPPVDREALRGMRTADVLVLDDLGSFRINDWQRELLMPVIDERWQHARPIIVTSNMPKLRKPLGPRLASRLADGATVVAMNGEDRRAAR